jgi:hypothetical protein
VSELERALVALGGELDLPEAPDLTAGVRARMRPRDEADGWWRHGARRHALALGLALLLAVLAATLAIPEARSALFRVLHIGGARIELVDELPRVPAEPDLELSLGTRVSLEEARHSAGFRLRELDRKPDRVYLGVDDTVWFLYGSPERPRLLVSQTPLRTLDQDVLVKKLAGPGTRVEPVLVGGAPGVYLGGEAHFLFLLDELGNPVEDSARLARDVLLWSESGVGYRLEGDLDRDRALELARSLR